MAIQILYQNIADDIKKSILLGNYQVGEMLPTENDLEAKYEVSKITVRKAIDQLVSEGYLFKKSGVGTRVISNNLFNKLSKARSYSSIVNEQGILSKQVLQVDVLDVTQTPLDGLVDSPKIVYIKRLYFLDKTPFIIVEHYLPNIAVPSRIEELQNQSLYKFLKDSGQNVKCFKDEFSAIYLDKGDAKLLQVTTDLGLRRIRRGFNNTGKIIEYTVSVYDSNMLPYSIEYEI